MDIPLEISLANSPHPIHIPTPIVLLHSNLLPIFRHTLHPSHMSRSFISLRNSAFLRRFVHLHLSGARGVVPVTGIAPVLAFVMVGEVDLVDGVEAPGYEASAFALVEVPGVDIVGCVAGGFVGVVVAGRGEGDAGGIAGFVVEGVLEIDWDGEGRPSNCQEIEHEGQFHVVDGSVSMSRVEAVRCLV